MPELDGLQRMLLTYASRGLSNKEIGQKFEKSERTIKNKFTDIYKALKTEKYPRVNRTLACMLAVGRGLIEAVE